MNTHPDFEELLRLLEENGVDSMIVGATPSPSMVIPLFDDIELFFRATEENVDRLRKALVSFGFDETDLPASAFLSRGSVLAFGVVPTRVDLVNEIDGVGYDEAKANVVRGTYGKVSVPFIGRADLIRNKKAIPRARDKADVEDLE